MVEEINNCDLVLFEKKLRLHLKGLNDDKLPWRLCNSSLCGRGVFATRKIETNEMIFRDSPIIVGPRAMHTELPSCVVCYKRVKMHQVCKNGCAMPVCDDEKCQCASSHKDECQLISEWKPKQTDIVSMTILRALSSIRGLLLNEEDTLLLKSLQSNKSVQTVMEIKKAIDEFLNFPTGDADLIEKLSLISSTLNTNAHETKLPCDLNEEENSLRGLYPLSCMMNHQCTPNVRYSFDKDYVMTIKAVRPIDEGEEIFSSYIQLFWGTLSRRLHLKATKSFLCSCPRCSDPTENQSFISALKCAKQECLTGRLLPINSLVISSPWKCSDCGIELNFKQISRIQNVLSSVILSKLKKNSLHDVQHFLKTTAADILPNTNQFAIELKLFAIWHIGDEKHATVSDFSLEDFKEKEKYCLELMDILERLKAGECTIKGLIGFELYKCRKALKELQWGETFEKQQQELLQNCWQLLQGNVIAPKDLAEEILLLSNNYGN